MKIFVAPMGVPDSYAATPRYKELAGISRDGRHELVHSAAEADACLFVDCHNLRDPISLLRIWRTDTFKRYRSKCYVYDQRPRAYCSLPGVVASMPSSLIRTDFQLPWGYQWIEPLPAFAESRAAQIQPDLLFSFVGTGSSHPCRPALLELRHPRSIVEQVDGHVNWQPNQPGYVDRRQNFADVTSRSKFVLCPRGRATSSIRFYEAMALGRVPVVIADDWEPPHGIALDTFALRWPEATTDGLIEFLEAHEEQAAALGAEAKRVYNENFSRAVTFDRVGDLLEELVENDVWSRFPRWGFPPDRRVVRHLAGRSRKVLGKAARMATAQVRTSMAREHT